MSAVEKVLADLVLQSGGHSNFESGACLLEAASFVAGEPWSDHPQCVSTVLAAFGRRFNDLLDDESRQLLKPFIPRLLNTAGDGQDEARRLLAADWAIRVGTPRWLELAGLTVHAEALRALPAIVDDATWRSARAAVRAARDAAYEVRQSHRASLVAAVKAELVKTGWKPGQPFPAVADAVADAAAVAVAVADAVAAADADAVADAVAVAVAVADAVAAADADAVAVADAVADADAADIPRYSDRWWAIYDAVRKEVRKALEQKPESFGEKFAEVAAVNKKEGFELFERMIDPSAVKA